MPSRPDPAGYALYVPDLTDLFGLIGVEAAVWRPPRWRAIYIEPSIKHFELRYGADHARSEYNQRCIGEAMRTGRSVVGHFVGLSDYFVPIVGRSGTLGLLAAGPIAEDRPESATLLDRWSALTGRAGHVADPEFAEYVSAALTTLVFDAQQAKAFKTYLECLAQMMSSTGNVARISARAEPLRSGLEAARNVERMWEEAHSMVDERTTRSWPTPARLDSMTRLGLDRVPDEVLVALMVSSHTDRESVDDLVRRDAFQRSCVTLAQKTGKAVSGKIGDSGVSFLSAAGGSADARRRKLLELGEAATRLARKSGFELYLGTSDLRGNSTLAAAFQAALGAAENGIMRRVHVVSARAASKTPSTLLGDLRRDLARLAEEQPRSLPARFESYLEAVGHHSGHRLEFARIHLEVAFQRIAESFRERAAIEEKSYRDMFDDLARAVLDAATLHDLFETYRRAVRDIVEASVAPSTARRERSLRRGLSYVRRHYTEPLSLPQVAKVSGFSAKYFSELFKKAEKVTFERYLRGLRVERAKHLLSSTELALQRVAVLSGFASPSYFATVFRQSAGMTPGEFRLRGLPESVRRRRAPG
jgi:AraC-like DNA-binding protein